MQRKPCDAERQRIGEVVVDRDAFMRELGGGRDEVGE
jgi:hypothetical protein